MHQFMHVHATARNRALVEANEIESEHREQNDRERDDGETGRVDRRAGCVASAIVPPGISRPLGPGDGRSIWLSRWLP